MSSSVPDSAEPPHIAGLEQGGTSTAPTRALCASSHADEPPEVDDLKKAQSEWRARKRREFEEKRRKKEQRQQALANPKDSVNSTSSGNEHAHAHKKPRLEDHADLDALHHHHLHHLLHHHHHHHLHHPDHDDDLHYHHHHHQYHIDPNLALHLADHIHENEPCDLMRELKDQKLAQALWREQKRREIAERKAKRNSSGRPKKTSTEQVNSVTISEPHIEDVVPSNSSTVPNVPAFGEDGMEVASTNHSRTVALEASAELSHSDPLVATPVTEMTAIDVAASALERTRAMGTAGVELDVANPGNVVHIGLPAPQSASASSLDATLPVQTEYHMMQTQCLTAEQVLGSVDDDQDLHNSLLNNWQSLDPLAPSH